MKVRSGPSLDHSQVDRLSEGTIITVLEEETAGDGSVWGRVGEDKWVCLSDDDYVYASRAG